MGVGAVMTSSQYDNTLTSLAVRLRDLAQKVTNLNLEMVTSGGTTWLTSIGYSNTANPANPGSISDAAYADLLIADLYVIAAGIYFGLYTRTPAHDYNTEFSVLWAGTIT